MRTLLLLVPLALPLMGAAQQVIATGGDHHANATNAITYTIGEPVIATVSADGNTLTQGFNQPWADIHTAVDDNASDDATITVYPNPVRHTLHIALGDATQADRWTLHDAIGQLVIDGRINSTLTDIDMERYASGGYVLRVSDRDEKLLKFFKISVTH